jgi:hypothetical protein
MKMRVPHELKNAVNRQQIKTRYVVAGFAKTAHICP